MAYLLISVVRLFMPWPVAALCDATILVTGVSSLAAPSR